MGQFNKKLYYYDIADPFLKHIAIYIPYSLDVCVDIYTTNISFANTLNTVNQDKYIKYCFTLNSWKLSS